MIEPHPEGVLLSVRVHPGAKRNEIRGEHDDALRVSVTTAPEKGKANKAVVEFLAKSFGIRKSQLQILSGETSTQKRILIAGVSEEEIRERISKD